MLSEGQNGKTDSLALIANGTASPQCLCQDTARMGIASRNLLGSSLCNNAAAIASRIWSQVDDPIGRGHDLDAILNDYH